MVTAGDEELEADAGGGVTLTVPAGETTVAF